MEERKEFVIEVGKKDKDDDFTFSDLQMFHPECYGGSLEYQEYLDSYGLVPSLTCRRCGWRISTAGSGETNLPIVKTAVDGQKREVPLRSDIQRRYRLVVVRRPS